MVVAVLQALNHRDAFKEKDVAVLELLGSLVGGVIARAALVEAAVREQRRAAALLKCAEAVYATSHCLVKASHVMQAVKYGLDCERSSVYLVDEVNAQQVCVFFDNETMAAQRMQMPIDEGISGAVISSAAPVCVLDAQSDARFSTARARAAIRSVRSPPRPLLATPCAMLAISRARTSDESLTTLAVCDASDLSASS